MWWQKLMMLGEHDVQPSDIVLVLWGPDSKHDQLQEAVSRLNTKVAKVQVEHVDRLFMCEPLY